MAIEIVPFAGNGEATTAVNIRSAPNTLATIEHVLVTGDPVVIDGKVSNDGLLWYQIKWHDAESYVAAEYVQVDGPEPGCPQGVLPVPWHSQIQTDGSGHDLCGETCVEMFLDFYHKTHGDLHELAGYLGKWGQPTGYDDLVRLAAHYGLNINVVLHDGSLGALRTALVDQQRPVIALVDYVALPFPVHLVSGKRQGAHWLVITGVTSDDTDNTFYVNDPLWLASQRKGRGGECLPITLAQLERALLPNLANHIAIA